MQAKQAPCSAADGVTDTQSLRYAPYIPISRTGLKVLRWGPIVPFAARLYPACIRALREPYICELSAAMHGMQSLRKEDVTNLGIFVHPWLIFPRDPYYL